MIKRQKVNGCIQLILVLSILIGLIGCGEEQVEIDNSQINHVYNTDVLKLIFLK